MKCPICGATCGFRGNKDYLNTEYWHCYQCNRVWIVVDHLPPEEDADPPLCKPLTRNDRWSLDHPAEPPATGT